MLKKIFSELAQIKQELQAIRSSLEPKHFVGTDSSGAKYYGLSNSTGPVQANHLQNQ